MRPRLHPSRRALPGTAAVRLTLVSARSGAQPHSVTRAGSIIFTMRVLFRSAREQVSLVNLNLSSYILFDLSCLRCFHRLSVAVLFVLTGFFVEMILHKPAFDFLPPEWYQKSRSNGCSQNLTRRVCECFNEAGKSLER